MSRGWADHSDFATFFWKESGVAYHNYNSKVRDALMGWKFCLREILKPWINVSNHTNLTVYVTVYFPGFVSKFVAHIIHICFLTWFICPLLLDQTDLLKKQSPCFMCSCTRFTPFLSLFAHWLAFRCSLDLIFLKKKKLVISMIMWLISLPSK